MNEKEATRTKTRKAAGTLNSLDVRPCALAQRVVCCACRIAAAIAASADVARASLIQLDGVGIAVAPLMRKWIARAQLVARREKKRGAPGLVGMRSARSASHDPHPYGRVSLQTACARDRNFAAKAVFLSAFS